MTIAEVRAYYGDRAAEFAKQTMAKSEKPWMLFQFRNPKHRRSFLKATDDLKSFESPVLPDEVRYSDTVRVER